MTKQRATLAAIEQSQQSLVTDVAKHDQAFAQQQDIIDQLTLGDMPPKKAEKQPSAEEKAAMQMETPLDFESYKEKKARRAEAEMVND